MLEDTKAEVKAEIKAEGIDSNGLNGASSLSQASEASQTAAEFIDSQLALEAEAREALPYTFDSCTKPLGSLRQSVFSCLTCNPPSLDPLAPYAAAGLCYSCSIACHGEHELVEIFTKRNFNCDCGTTRFSPSTPCTLRISSETRTKGNVHSEAAADSNHYDQNFANRFCGCERVYDAHKQRGTMFQCLGLGYAEDGGCGEDWWHPSCLTGHGPDWIEQKKPVKQEQTGDTAHSDSDGDNDEEPVPPGFPQEEDFESFLCYKCVDANPWIRIYATSAGFLAPVVHNTDHSGPTVEPKDEFKMEETAETKTEVKPEDQPRVKLEEPDNDQSLLTSSSTDNLAVRKRKAEDDTHGDTSPKKIKSDVEDKDFVKEEGQATPVPRVNAKPAYHTTLAPPPPDQFSLFFKPDFRTHFCRCADCFPRLSRFPQLLEEEESYEPPRSEGSDANGPSGSSVGTASLLDRGEAALNAVDRVRAIEGVMAYNHLKEKVKTFLKPFAESGEVVGADDVKKYFEKLRGDDEAMREANRGAGTGGADGDTGGEGDGGFKREQSGY
ncbi:MAG: hypothetical protein M1814_005267 [Vezdaea aestivalis]|nr:MAG: hypothetical protein M1814_005267 [Vezdaea aestivalis]